jgi:endonuclease I
MKKLILLTLLLPLFVTSQIINTDSSSINFGVVLVGETDSALVTLTNAEPGTLNVTNIKFYSIYGEVPFSAAQTVFTIPGNGSTSVWIYFSPIQNILHNSTMVVQHSATSGHEAISLGGQGRFALSYYNSTENLNEQALKIALKARLTLGQTTLSYSAARNAMFMTIDNKRFNGQGATVNTLECVYTGFNKTSYTSRSDAQNTNPQFNTEHTFPQGFFNSASPMRTDIHHLYPTTNNSNSQRGSKPFGTVNGGTAVTLGGGSFYNNTTFEPRNIQKGATSRAMMYFVIRYQDYSNHFSVQQNILKTWHNTYLVDSVEQRRNDDIFTTQGNRNPFVDYPQLEKRITNFVANSVTPSVNGLDVLQTSINFGTFFAQTSDTFDYVLVNTGNQVINFTNFALSNLANLSFAAGSGTNTALNPGEAIEISVIAASLNSTTINESLTFSTNLTFPRNNFTIPISGQSVVVGLNDQELKNTIQVYPNPIQDNVYIRNEGSQKIDIRLLDVAGKSLDVKFLNQNGSYYLPTKEIASGLYFIEISSGDQRIVKKVVKQ